MVKKVTFEVLFISIFHWCFNDMPRSGCSDAVWWIVRFLLYGGLGFGGLAVTLVSGISISTDAPSFRRSFCIRWSGGISRDRLDMDPVSGALCSGCVVLHGV